MGDNVDDNIPDVEADVESGDPSRVARARGYIQEGLTANREWYINLLLVLLLLSGFAMIVTLFVEFWAIDMDLLGEPSPVWAQMMWFFPSGLVVLLLAQVLFFGVQTNPIKAPSIWLVVFSGIAFIFNIPALVHYQGDFWACVTDTGNSKPLQMDICDNSLLELSTIAWVTIALVAHAAFSGLAGILAYTSDTDQFKIARSFMVSGAKKAARRAQSAGKGAAVRLKAQFSEGSIGRAHTQGLIRRDVSNSRAW